MFYIIPHFFWGITTIASEGISRVPTLYVNSLPLMGYLRLEQKLQLLKHFQNCEGLISYVKEILCSKSILAVTKQNSKKMKENFEDPNKFLSEFIHRNI